MKKLITVFISLCLFFSVSFAFDPYAGEVPEKKSKTALYCGFALALIGGFLAVDGFSRETVDISKPIVDFTTVLHGEWYQRTQVSPFEYELKSGSSDFGDIEQNIVYNAGNVDLRNVIVEVRYLDKSGSSIADDYHTVTQTATDIRMGESFRWQDIWGYSTIGTDAPYGEQTNDTRDKGIYLGEDALNLIDIRIDLSNSYTPIYKTKNKSDIEGVSGLVLFSAGVYLIIDYFVSLNEFNKYVKENNISFKLAQKPNEYKLLLQKRL